MNQHGDTVHQANSSLQTPQESLDSMPFKFKERVQLAIPQVQNVLNHIQRNKPDDYIVEGRGLGFWREDSSLKVRASDPVGPRFMHDNALGQICQDSHFSHRYLKYLMSKTGPGNEWALDLAAHNLNELFQKAEPKRYLLRTVGSVIRGFMSNRYACFDSGPMLEAYLEAASQFEVFPYWGMADDLQWYVKMIQPTVYEPVPDEKLVFGSVLKHSDFGIGAWELTWFVSREKTGSTLISSKHDRQVHRGSRVLDTEMSLRMLEVNTGEMVSRTKESMKGIFSPPAIQSRINFIRRAYSEGLDIEKALLQLRARGKLTKEDTDALTFMLENSTVETIPVDQSKMRLATAISIYAQRFTDIQRVMDLEALAGQVVGLHELA